MEPKKLLVLPILSRNIGDHILPLPDEWYQALDTILHKTNLRDTVAEYPGIQVERADIARVVPTDSMERATADAPKGWLNDKIIEVFLRMIADKCNEASGHPSVWVVNSVVVTDLKTTGPKTSANKIGIEPNTLPNLDTILFLSHSRDHRSRVVAKPKSRVVELYDSLAGTEKGQLTAVKGWLEAVEEGKGEPWTLQHVKCPQHDGASMCGVCVCINAMFVLEGADPVGGYSAGHTAGLRLLAAASLCKGIR